MLVKRVEFDLNRLCDLVQPINFLPKNYQLLLANWRDKGESNKFFASSRQAHKEAFAITIHWIRFHLSCMMTAPIPK